MAEFTTKDSGERVQFQTGMHRDTNTGKALFHLMLPLGVPYREQMLTRLAELYGRGAQKYAARNWELAQTREELERFKESAFRHFVQWLTGETDEDHAAAVLFNVIGAEYVEYRLREKDMIDEAAKAEGLRSEFLSVPIEELQVDRDTGRVFLVPQAPLAQPSSPQDQYPVTLRVFPMDPEETLE